MTTDPYVLYCDGALPGNGTGADDARIAVYDAHLGAIVHEESLKLSTNNRAEYAALHAAIAYTMKTVRGPVVIRSDSRLIVEQMAGAWQVNDAVLAAMREACLDAKGARNIRIEWVSRRDNPAGHYLEETAP